jgi:hypothetical protein
MDARRAPQRIVHADPPDQRPQVYVDLRRDGWEENFS